MTSHYFSHLFSCLDNLNDNGNEIKNNSNGNEISLKLDFNSSQLEGILIAQYKLFLKIHFKNLKTLFKNLKTKDFFSLKIIFYFDFVKNTNYKFKLYNVN